MTQKNYHTKNSKERLLLCSSDSRHECTSRGKKGGRKREERREGKREVGVDKEVNPGYENRRQEENYWREPNLNGAGNKNFDKPSINLSSECPGGLDHATMDQGDS